MLKLVMMALVVFGMTSAAQADEAKDNAVKLVQEVMQFAKDKGIDAAVSAVNKGQFTKGELYPTIFNQEGKCLAHGSKPARAGQNLLHDKDPDGKEFVKERLELAKKGPGWQNFKFQNPTTKKLESKDMYFEPTGEFVIAAGAYAKK